ncbi:hypothetical protein [Metabacillus sp. FJAT-52054]|uniref:Uncharacterized protein n=1 Tax=Metabacillus sediminis TaxID=3117746 RepID=A0ABZ2NL69_9BACI
MNFLKKWLGPKEQKDCCNVIIEEVKDDSCCSKQMEELTKAAENSGQRNGYEARG